MTSNTLAKCAAAALSRRTRCAGFGGGSLKPRLRKWATTAAATMTMGSVMSFPAVSQVASYVMLDPDKFLTQIDGKSVDLFTIRNRNGIEVRITNYGARIEQVLVPDRHGQLVDVVQGYETIDQVKNGQASMGAFIGRFANRIAKGSVHPRGKRIPTRVEQRTQQPARW